MGWVYPTSVRNNGLAREQGMKQHCESRLDSGCFVNAALHHNHVSVNFSTELSCIRSSSVRSSPVLDSSKWSHAHSRQNHFEGLNARFEFAGVQLWKWCPPIYPPRETSTVNLPHFEHKFPHLLPPH